MQILHCANRDVGLATPLRCGVAQQPFKIVGQDLVNQMSAPSWDRSSNRGVVGKGRWVVGIAVMHYAVRDGERIEYTLEGRDVLLAIAVHQRNLATQADVPLEQPH